MSEYPLAANLLPRQNAQRKHNPDFLWSVFFFYMGHLRDMKIDFVGVSVHICATVASIKLFRQQSGCFIIKMERLPTTARQLYFQQNPQFASKS